MYETESAQCDHTRLQLMFDGSTPLALGWRLTGGMPRSQRKPIFDPHDAVLPYWNAISQGEYQKRSATESVLMRPNN